MSTMGIITVMGKRGRPKRRSGDLLMTFLITTWFLMAAALVSLLIYLITDDVQDGGHALPSVSIPTSWSAPHDSAPLQQ